MDVFLAVGLAVVTGLMTPVLLRVLRAGRAFGVEWWAQLSGFVASTASRLSIQLRRGLQAARLAPSHLVHRPARAGMATSPDRLSQFIGVATSRPAALKVRRLSVRRVVSISGAMHSMGQLRWSRPTQARSYIQCDQCGHICPSSALYCRRCGHPIKL